MIFLTVFTEKGLSSNELTTFAMVEKWSKKLGAGWMDVTQSKSRRNNKRDDLYKMSGNILINWIISHMVFIGYKTV